MSTDTRLRFAHGTLAAVLGVATVALARAIL
jgi:hypothetical protein